MFAISNVRAPHEFIQVGSKSTLATVYRHGLVIHVTLDRQPYSFRWSQAITG
jgi:hypothetical protein